MYYLLLLSLSLLVVPLKTKADSIPQVFTEIYNQQIWGANEDGIGWSGIGSAKSATKFYRDFLQLFFKEFKIKSVVDLGCGDWEFSCLIDWDGINYHGFDAVAHVIKKNKQLFETDTITFDCADATQYELPPADLLICKDVLQHLTNDDVIKIAGQFNKYKYCLITNGVDPSTFSSHNYDISRGDYRYLDLGEWPFNIPGKKIAFFESAGSIKQIFLIQNIN